MKNDLRLDQIVERRLSGIDVRDWLRTAVYARPAAERRRGRPPVRRGVALMLALLLSLLGVGTALALSDGSLLSRLFPSSAPSEPAVNLLRPLQQTYEANGCRFELRDSLFDGHTLHVNWTASSELNENILFTVSGFSIDGVEAETEGWPESLCLETLVDLQDGDYSAFTIGQFGDETLPEEFNVSMTAYFLRPLAPIVEPSSLPKHSSEKLLLKEHNYGDYTFINEITGFERTENGYSSDTYASDDNLNNVEAGVQGGFYEIVQQFEISFVVRPDAAHIARTRIAGNAVFENDYYRIEFTKAEITAANVDIQYTIESKLDIDRMDEDWVLWALAFDVTADGKSYFDRLQMDKGGGRTSDGHRVYDGSIWGLPFDEIPSEITLTPIVENMNLPGLEPMTLKLEID